MQQRILSGQNFRQDMVRGVAIEGCSKHEMLNCLFC